MIRLGVVIPCYNESAVLPETSRRIQEVFKDLIDKEFIQSNSFILFVNDGSNDNTWDLIRDLHASSEIFYGLKLAHNVGHQHALLAGLMTAKELCDAVISIDADLQDDINIIKDMVIKFSQGIDIVYGVRKERKSDTFLKKFTALAFYRLMKALGVKTIYNHADYRLMSKRSLNHLEKFKEKNLFLRGIVPLIGYKSENVYYNRDIRFAGESKYPISKMLNFAIDGITSFSVKPLRIIFGLGFFTMILSLIAFIYILISYFSGKAVIGWPSLIISVWFLSSLIIISIGVLGEYIGKIYTETKARPQYNIESILSHEDNQN